MTKIGMNGFARVGRPSSVVNLKVRTVKDTFYEEICGAMKKASETYLKGILRHTEDEVVSSDFIHEPVEHFRRGSGIQMSSRFRNLVSWHENEWGLQRAGASTLSVTSFQKQWPCLNSAAVCRP